MGEYDDLSDLVRDGSTKLRDSKSSSDETILMYNRSRQSYQPHLQHPPPTLSSKTAFSSGNSQHSNTVNTSDVMKTGDLTTNTSSPGSGGAVSDPQSNR
jgi:hypothetical protein